MTDHVTAGTIFLAASSVGGSLAGGMVGPLNFPLADFGWATFFVAIGTVGREFLDAKAARDRVPISERRNHLDMDLVSLVYAIFAAPLIGGIALALVRGVGFIPDAGAAPALMWAGYQGRDGLNWATDLFRDFITKRVQGVGHDNSNNSKTDGK